MLRLAAAFALAWLASDLHAQSSAVDAATAPAPAVAPGFVLSTPDGQRVRFPDDARGQPAVLMFWPSWCPFSRALQPYVYDIWRDYRDAGVRVWTLNIKENRDPVAVLRERNLPDLPLLVRADDVARRYGLAYTPWLVVVDGSGKIVYTRPPNPPSPVDTAREVRTLLNQLLGDRAVPLPASYPKPYDLHLKDPATLGQRLAPRELPPGELQAFAQRVLDGIPADARDVQAVATGPVDSGKAAIARAKALWTERFGAETTTALAPYRAYRQGDRWLVIADGPDGALGSGLLAALRAGDGSVIRVWRGDSP